MMRILYTIGTRPEVIRSAAIIRELGKVSTIGLDLVNTGQHYDRAMMSDLVHELGVPPATHMLSRATGNAARRIGLLVKDLADVLAINSYDAIVVYGDTDSSLAAALAGVKCCIPVVHIEAGCRSGDLRMQEELNRRMIDHVSALNLAVSENCITNLQRESVPGRVVLTGDPQFDVFVANSPEVVRREDRLKQGFVTMHRAENVDDPQFLSALVNSLGSWGEGGVVSFLWPAHPRTAGFFAGFDMPECVKIVTPMSYRDALGQLSQSVVCITDSGGLQKEAFWLQVPCVTMRRSTEWIETVEANANMLVPNPSELHGAIRHIMTSAERIAWAPDPYGGIDSARRVARAIASWVLEKHSWMSEST